MEEIKVSEKLYVAKQQLLETSDKLEKLISQSVWSDEKFSGFDNSVEILGDLNNTITVLTQIEEHLAKYD